MNRFNTPRPPGLRYDLVPLTSEEEVLYRTALEVSKADPEARPHDLMLAGLQAVLANRGVIVAPAPLLGLLCLPYGNIDEYEDPHQHWAALGYCLQGAEFRLGSNDEETLHRIDRVLKDLHAPQEPSQAEAESFLASEIKRVHPKLRSNSKEYKRLWEKHLGDARLALYRDESKRAAHALAKLPALLAQVETLNPQAISLAEPRLSVSLAVFGKSPANELFRESMQKCHARFRGLATTICRRMEAFSAWLEAHPLPKPNCKGCPHLHGEHIDLNVLVRWHCRKLNRIIGKTHDVSIPADGSLEEVIAPTPETPTDCPGRD